MKAVNVTKLTKHPSSYHRPSMLCYAPFFALSTRSTPPPIPIHLSHSHTHHLLLVFAGPTFFSLKQPPDVFHLRTTCTMRMMNNNNYFLLIVYMISIT